MPQHLLRPIARPLLPAGPALLGVALLLATASRAAATGFAFENGVKLDWKTTVSVGQARRMDGADPRLLNTNNASLLGVHGATGGNTDDGDLNYGDGQAFSTLANLNSELALRQGDLAAVVGIRAWRDFTLTDTGVAHGSFNNHYQPGAPLDDRGFETFAKFSNVAFMNAYVTDGFDTRAGRLSLTAGRHVLNWGSELFVQGLNQINALNLNVLRAPGMEASDLQLPQGMLSARLDAGQGRRMEAFWQFEFQDTVYPGCGTYFLPVDATVGPNAQNACAAGLVQATRASGDQGGIAGGLYAPAAATHQPSGSGQGGIALHWPVEALAGDAGLYALSIHSRTPVLSAIKGNSPFVATTALLGAAGHQGYLFWDYPRDVHILGLSTNSRLGKWKVGSEFTWIPNAPVQLAGGDLLGAYVYSANPAILAALLRGQGVPAAAATPVAGLISANEGPLGPRFAATPNGGVVNGYDRVHKSQLQLNAVRAFGDVLGAATASLAGEIAVQHADIPGDPGSGVRYGRGFVFGTANGAGFNLGAFTALPGAAGTVGRAVTQNGTCPVLNAPGQAGCADHGFATPWSAGLRLRGQLVYPGLLGGGVTLKPTLAVSSDFSGWSVDGQFNEGRQVIQASLIAEFAQRWTAQASVVTFNHSAAWDPLRDRDYYAASLKVAF